MSVDTHLWSSQGYHFQFMPHMEEEANVMIHNLIPVLIFKYREDRRAYFFPEAGEAANDDYLDDTLNIVMCNTDKNMAEAEESDAIGLNIALEFSKKYQEELDASSKANE